MERIKEALNGARAERERKLAAEQADGSLARRLRLFSTFEHLAEDVRRAVLAAGEIREFDGGETICAIGDRDEYVNYLLDGMVRMETADGASRLLHAGDGPSRFALDEAGEKTATVVALHPVRVFRITPAQLIVALEAAESQPLPTSAYTETFNGQQLAMLVGALREEHRGLSGVAATRTSPAPASTPEVLVGDHTLGISLDVGTPDLESTRGPVPPDDGALESPPAQALAAVLPMDAISTMTRTFESELRQHVENVRNAERAHAQIRIKAYAAKLKAKAEEEIRAKVKIVRSRYEQAHAARELDLRKRYEQLLALANRLARQKAEIYQARHQMEEKLKRAEQLHRELSELGGMVSHQLDQIDGLLPTDDSELKHFGGTKAGD